MRIVKSFQRIREFRKISQRVLATPTPKNYELLCERLLADKGPAAALPRIEEAIEKFPWSERLQVLAFQIRRSQKRNELIELKKLLVHSPTPESYGRLAEIFRQIGDEDEAIRLCRECAARFPQNENAYLVEGRLRVARLRRTGSVRDGVLAVEKLERAVVLNPENMKARRLLSEIYFEIGAWDHARGHLEFMTANTIPDDRIQEMTRIVLSVEGSSREPENDLFSLFRRKRLGVGAATQSETKRFNQAMRPKLDAIKNQLESYPGVQDIVLLEGVQNWDLHRPDARSVCELNEDSETSDLSRCLARTTQASLIEMDMGNLRYGQISGEWGHLMLFRFCDKVLALKGSPELNLESLRDEVLSIPAPGAQWNHDAPNT